MSSNTELQKTRIEDEPEKKRYYLQKFRLYETRSKFYMIGRDKSRTLWRVLKIDRTEPTQLSIREDSTIYTETECNELLTRIHEGNRSTGGLRFVTTCYGIIGFIKFLGPYYMLLITKRMKIGAIGPHAVYAIAKREMIALPYTTGMTNMAYSKIENRYKKLLCTVDLTKDFFFSYSYPVMRSLQKNLCEGLTGQVLYEKMFVWNEFLTRGIRHCLQNTLWTVALVHGFFKQDKLSIAGRSFKMTLIARRSRHYAGTRYLKRGVNEKGRVANDVETEQLVFEDAPEGCPVQISSVVQNRGSIPLFWSQETSRLNIRPDIILSEKNQNYEATRQHFENLRVRYGHPIIILNLIKTRERKPRESILRAEFVNAIEFINKDRSEDSHLKFIHWDIHRRCRRRPKSVLTQLGKIASNALKLTGFFYCQVTSELAPTGSFQLISHERNDVSDSNVDKSEADDTTNGNQSVKPPIFQHGVLRTNCIDCLDRTNVAQYSYGLAALGHQLEALGFIDVPDIDSFSLADDLMRWYEAMGDTLALQYGGSPAHNKIFSERRGQSKAAIQSQEFFRTLQRYYSNAYMDAEKQDAINIFLGHFQPQEGKPALWELNSDQHYNVGARDQSFGDTATRSMIQRSLSDGNILGESSTTTPISATNVWQKKLTNFTVSEKPLEDTTNEEFTSDISTCQPDIKFSRYAPTMARKQLFVDMQSEQMQQMYFDEDPLNCSNFVDFDWLSSSDNSEELNERTAFINSSFTGGMSSENVIPEEIPVPSENEFNIIKDKTLAEEESPVVEEEFSESFVRWVDYGEALCHPHPNLVIV